MHVSSIERTSVQGRRLERANVSERCCTLEDAPGANAAESTGPLLSGHLQPLSECPRKAGAARLNGFGVQIKRKQSDF